MPKDSSSINVDKTEGTISNSFENSSSLLDNASPSTSAGTSKRKENPEDENDVPKPKKLKNTANKLSDTTVKKLTQFAFTKSKVSK